MAATPSNMMPLGTVAPPFHLQDTVTGKMMSLDELKSTSATVIMFICNHCPYVLHIIGKLVQVAREYRDKGVAFIAISSNDIINYPEDAPDKMRSLALDLGFTFPYLYDESQEVARWYDAACTPDIYIFDGKLRCAYRGQFDDARPKNNIPVSGKDLKAALDDILTGKPVSIPQKPSIGCNIKWKSP